MVSSERSEIFSYLKKFYYTNETIQKRSQDIFDVFVEKMRDPWSESIAGKKNELTVLDIPYLPDSIEDKDLSFLGGIFGYNPKYVRRKKNGEDIHPEISPEGIRKLNYILDMASKHSRRAGLSISFFIHYLKQWCDVKREEDGKYKIFFKIQDTDDYHAFLSFITTHKKETKEEWVFNEKSGFFLKNILCFSDIEKNDIYQNRRTLFQYITTDIFGKFLHQDIPIDVNTKTEKKEHEHSVDFQTSISHFEKPKKMGEEKDDERFLVRLLGNVKSQASLMDKMMRERTYGDTNAINDMIRFQINGGNYKQTLTLLHTFIDYYFSNPHEYFDIDETDAFGGLKIIDKGIRNTTSVGQEHTLNDLPEGRSKEIILSAKEKRKGAGSYRDIKLLIPMKMRGKMFNVELKFVLPDREKANESGVGRHEVYKILDYISQKTRHQKFLQDSDIEEKAKITLEKSPILRDELGDGDKVMARNKLFEHAKKTTQKVQIPGTDTTFNMDRKTYDLFANTGFLPPLNLPDDEDES